jgi:hypothetical protein
MMLIQYYYLKMIYIIYTIKKYLINNYVSLISLVIYYNKF